MSNAPHGDGQVRGESGVTGKASPDGFWNPFSRSLGQGLAGWAIAVAFVAAVRLFLGAPDWGVVLLTGLVFLVCQVAVSVSEAAAKGPERTLLRAGLVAFCRTLLPLVALAIAEYNGRLEFSREWVIAVAIFYFVPMVLGLSWTMRELKAKP
jgi:hypothetical protein